MAEFTGERLIPGQVDVDLLNEHMARYSFAARLARGKRVLDAGCGAGYGSAELSRTAARVVGADVAHEAVDFARAHYQAPNLTFERASCTALPHADGAFDLVVAFEVIEHLSDWRGFLAEVRRLLAACGQFVVSTPNRLYYTESRGAEGANPFHVHEFDFDEFRGELEAVFPHVSLFLENHVEGVVFQPHSPGTTVEARVDAGEPEPAESHFFVAVCAHRPQVGNPTFLYVPRAANVLRERERHIGLLERELADKDEWLDKLHAEHDELARRHEEQKTELDGSNRWAAELDRALSERGARIEALQREFAAEQENARSVAEGYAAKVLDLERDIREKAEWAGATAAEIAAVRAELGRAVEVLDARDKELDERTAWALRLQEEGRALERLLSMVKASRWIRLGRKVGLGPELPPG